MYCFEYWVCGGGQVLWAYVCVYNYDLILKKNIYYKANIFGGSRFKNIRHLKVKYEITTVSKIMCSQVRLFSLKSDIV